MSAGLSAKLEASLTEYKGEMLRVEGELTKLERERRTTRLITAFYETGRSLRRLVDRTILWRPGGMLILTTVLGGFALVVSRSPMFAIIFGAASLICSVFLFLIPSDLTQNEAITSGQVRLASISTQIGSLQSRASELRAAADELSISLEQALIAQRRMELESSAQFRRQQLLAENWKAMRSVEFEKYLERVFIELGYSVETTRVTGDQGVDLLISCDGQRIAIQVKGYTDSVSNGAVQEAHAGRTFYGCHHSAVITNSRFTRSAIELAEKVGCILVHEDNLRHLVLAKIDLLEMCQSST